MLIDKGEMLKPRSRPSFFEKSVDVSDTILTIVITSSPIMCYLIIKVNLSSI